MINRASIKNLNDEEILKEFIKRFQCDGAILIYCDSNVEYGFGRWKNKEGRTWVKDIFKRIKHDKVMKLPITNEKNSINITL